MACVSGVRGTLVEFRYASLTAWDLPHAAVLRLARQAWSFNIRVGITGVFVVTGDRFRQIIEGEYAVVLPLASRILGDRRHRAIRIERFGLLAERRFDDWTVQGLRRSAPSPEASGEALGNLRVFPHAARYGVAEPRPAWPEAGGRAS